MRNHENDQFQKVPDVITIRKQLDKLMPVRSTFKSNCFQPDFSKNDGFRQINDMNIITVNVKYCIGDHEGKFEVRINIQNPISSLINICKRSLKTLVIPEDARCNIIYGARILDPETLVSKTEIKDKSEVDFMVYSSTAPIVRFKLTCYVD